MSKKSHRFSTEVSFGLDDLPKFSVGSFRHVSREERMNRIVTSVSENFSRDLSKIIKDSKQPARPMKTDARRATAKKKKT